MKRHTTVERRSEREIVVTRIFNAPVPIVFEAWSKPDLFKRWWVPKSMGMALLSCDMDVRTGGAYRLVFRFGDAEPMAFHGKYLEVIPPSRIVWTNAESGQGAVTTVTFEEKDGKTLLVMNDLYPSKDALEEEHGAEDATDETFQQLDELLVTMSP